MVGDPQRDRTATIRIQNLKENDGPMFCCRISIHVNMREKQGWQNRHGTYIYFKDQFSIEQPDVVPAMLGEGVSIPCVIHNQSPDNIEEIVWRFGENILCSENNQYFKWNKQNFTQKVGRWMVQKSETMISLHVMNVTYSEIRQYCCEVKTNSGTERKSAHGSQVVIAEHRNDPGVTQSDILSINEEDSVTISCSYNDPPGQVPLWREVFWRVGSPSGPFAYHPSELMVHPSYRGRSQIIGSADLQINGVRMSDHTTYYCFVMLKFCIGNNKQNSTLRYGSGTQLQIIEKNRTSAVIFAGVGVLLFLILLCIVLIILKKKGVICRKKESKKFSPSASMAPQNDVRVSNVPSSITATSQEDAGGTVYAHLNMESLQQGKGKTNKERPLSSDNQVLYAAVKPSTDQVIYAAVHIS
ncbi:uncharacterized protein [Pyxicephalus adspersus]|uniref:uncharacterized protein isoform X2 n=1 Tax=Pyxicephalus adspersus TaxID=30357 RepID=UPI003B5AA0EB